MNELNGGFVPPNKQVPEAGFAARFITMIVAALAFVPLAYVVGLAWGAFLAGARVFGG